MRVGRVDEGARGSRWVARGAVLIAAMLLLLPAIAYAADLPPHVTPEDGPDACAMCHRAHTAAGVVERSQYDTWETAGSALVLAQPSDTGDAALCLMCHGVDALGSEIEVQSDLLRASAHSMLPADSRYEGVPAKQCSSCHDAHGSDRRADKTPYPGLLRAATEDGDRYYSGDEYCATCHFEAREDNLFWGLAVYQQTAHGNGAMPAASDTEITCSNCHASHGSDVAPLIARKVFPSPSLNPGATESVAVNANDRTQCYACHTGPQATWPGSGTYDHESTKTVHGSSEVTVSVAAEYASAEATRLAGECQSCHNPMGVDRGDGTPIAKMAAVEGRELCYSCHNEENSDKGVVDMASWGVRSEEISTQPELVVAWDPENLSAVYGGLHVYTRAFGDNDEPYALEGPRPYAVSPGRTGAMAFGNIDDLTDDEFVVADPAASVLRVFRSDKLAGLANVSHNVTDPVILLEIGDFLAESTGLPEIAAVSTNANGESSLRLYRWEPGGAKGILSPVGAAYSVGYGATGIAAGNLGLGSAAADLVVTARSAEATNSAGAVFVLSQATSGDTVLAQTSFTTQAPGPRGPSVGSVLGGSPGIVVANSETTATPSISVYTPSGGSHTEYPVSGTSDALAWDTTIGTFMEDDGLGVAVAVRNEIGDSAVSFFPVEGSGLGTRSDITTGARFASSSLAAGKLTRSGQTQVALANAGVLSATAGQSVSPSVQVIEWTVSGFQVAETRWAGGTELAGNTPSVAIASLGPVGRSRHPASAVAQAHVSTETADFDRHAECVDCHNVHAATTEEASAPAAYGVIKGTWGVDVADSYAPVEGIEKEYELCFKCHGKPQWADSPRDIAAELDAGNAGFHPVMGASEPVDADTLVGDWQPGSQMYCIDCHGNAEATAAPAGPPAGPHVSSQAPLLLNPYVGVQSEKNTMLCYSCHKYAVYYTGDDGSDFFDLATSKQLHAQHIKEHGLGCASCHVSHGGEVNTRLLRTEIEWTSQADGGTCASPCHADTTSGTYSRQ